MTARLLAASVALATLVSAGPASSAAVVDFQDAAGRAVSATVAVEWKATGLPPGDQGAALPPAQEGSGRPRPPEHRQPDEADENTEAAAEAFRKRVEGEINREAIKNLPENARIIVKPLPRGLADEGARLGWKVDDATAQSIRLSSGTLISDQGLVVTMTGSNDASRPGKFSVTLEDGRTFPARLLVADRRSGLQLLKIDVEAAKLPPPLELANDQPRIGQPVLAAMATDLKERAVAQGIVAATKRRTSGLAVELVQTDLHVGPMSAGGPLVDAEGRLLGVVVAEGKRGAASVTFAVPVRYVRELFAPFGWRDLPADIDVPGGFGELLAGTREPTIIERGFLGVALKEPDDGPGVAVRSVIPDSPADRAGIEEGDRIVAVDGERVQTAEDVLAKIGRYKAGDKIAVTIARDGQEREIQVTLFRAPAAAAAPPGEEPPARAVWVVPRGYILSLPRQEGEEDRIIRGEILEQYRQALAEPTSPVIRVERSEVEKKLDQLTGEVQSLREELEKLTAELKKLRE